MAGRQTNINLRRERKRKADRRIATMVAQEMAAVLPNIINMMKPNDGDDNATPPPLPPIVHTPIPRCTFKHFNSEGATGLL